MNVYSKILFNQLSKKLSLINKNLGLNILNNKFYLGVKILPHTQISWIPIPIHHHPDLGHDRFGHQDRAARDGAAAIGRAALGAGFPAAAGFPPQADFHEGIHAVRPDGHDAVLRALDDPLRGIGWLDANGHGFALFWLLAIRLC